jgi:cyclic pyranopterin phosphate synthase
LGVKAIRLTGGEPLLRPRVWELVERIVSIREIEEVTLTTNGVLLTDQADTLAAAGLRRVNISLDSTDPVEYSRVTGRDAVSSVLQAIDVAVSAGLQPVKLNTVIGLTSDWKQQVLQVARMAIDRQVCVRFIERMPFGHEGRFPAPTLADVMQCLEGAFDVTPAQGPRGSGPARYYTVNGGVGTVGAIYPLSAPFCATCNRLRVTAQGQLRACLLSDASVDLREALCRPALERHALLCRAFKLAAFAKPRSHGSIAEARIRDMADIGG